VPYYDAAPATGKGALAFYIGGKNGDPLWFDENWESSYAPTWAHNNTNNWVVAAVPLKEVYHVTGLEVESFPEGQEGIFFWDDDSPGKWLGNNGTSGRVKDATLKVTYSNGQSRSITMEEAVRVNTVWYNLNPSKNERAVTVLGIDASVRGENNKTTSFWPNHKEPMIYFYYRGWKVSQPQVIFTKFSTLDAAPKDGGDLVYVNMKHEDNDYRGKYDADWFSKQITVTATFTAYSDSSKQKPIVLKYEPVDESITGKDNLMADVRYGKPFKELNSSGVDNWLKAQDRGVNGFDYPDSGTEPYWEGGPDVYSMDFGDIDYEFDPESRTWKAGNDAWGVCSVLANNGKQRPVTVYYTPGLVGTVATASFQITGDTPYPSGSEVPFAGSTPGTNVKSKRVQVEWSNIPVPVTP